MGTAQFKLLKLADIVPSSTNPRSHFEEVAVNELAESIREKGLLQPILVRPRSSDVIVRDIMPEQYEIVCGERRYRASLIAGLEDIPTMVRELDDDEAFELQIIENLQRKDVHPLDEAVGFLKMMKKQSAGKPRYTADEIARRVGKSERYIFKRLKLNDLTEDLQLMFFKDEIMLGHAEELCKLEKDGQAKALDWLGRRAHIASVSELKSYINQSVTMMLSAAAFPKKDEQLVPEAGACTTCMKRSGYNKQLFDEAESKEDRCFDQTCFHKKLNAYLKLKEEQLKEKGEPFVYVAAHYFSNADEKKYPGIVVEWNCTKVTAKNPCEHSKKGLMVIGNNVGHVITICNHRTCSVHGHGKNLTKEELYQQKVEALQQKTHKALVKDIRNAILESKPYGEAFYADLTEAEQTGLFYALWKRAEFDFKKILATKLLWGEIDGYQYEKTFQEKFPNTTREQKQMMLRLCILNAFSEYDPDKYLVDIAAAAKLPVDEIKARHEAVFQDKVKKLRQAHGMSAKGRTRKMKEVVS